MTTPSIRPVVCPALIGRDSYLVAIAATFTQVQEGAGRTVLVSGEAGIGKSRLLAEVISQAGRRGFICLLGAAYEADHDAPFAPLIDLLRGVVATLSDADLGHFLTSPSGSYLPELLPELASRASDGAPAIAGDPEQRKRRFYATLDDLLLGVARDQPALIALEDVHWADGTSLDYLLHLARRVAHLPVLLVVTYRSDEVHPALRHFLAGLDRERLATELALAPLGRSEVGDMLCATFALVRPPRTDLFAALYELTEGNPFFIEEVLHILVAGGAIFYANGHWDRKPIDEILIPRSVHDTVQRRALGLTDDAARALNLAAVLGRRFDFALLQTVGGYDEARLVALLKELIAAQLLVEESDERYRFRHALTRQAIYSELLVRERRLLHRTVAETVERLAATSSTVALPDLAYHYFAAGVWDKAAAYSQREGERAMSLFSPGAAVEHFTRALEATERQGDAPSLTVLRSRGAAYETLGEFERALADYERALELASAANVWSMEWQLLRDLGMLWSGRDYAQAGVYYRRAHERARASADASAIAHSLNSLGNWLLNVDETVEARRHHEEALAVFEALDDQHGIAETLDYLGMTLFLSGDLHGGTRAYARGIPLMRALDERKLLSSALATMPLRGMTWQTDVMAPAAENLTTSLVEAHESLGVAREIGWSAGEAFAHLILAYGLGSMGEYGAALLHVQAGEAISTEIEHQQWLCGLGCIHGLILLDLFALDDARTTLSEALRLARAMGSGHWVGCASSFLARCHLRNHALDEADAVLDDALPTDAPARTLGQRLLWSVRIEAALAHDEPARALRLADQLAASTPNATSPDDLPRVSWLRGQALAALGAHDEAERALLAAERHARTHGARPMLWRVQADLCALAMAGGRERDAERESSMRATVAALALTIPDPTMRATYLASATALLPAQQPDAMPLIAASPSRAARRATESPGGLTAREREVATLVAHGLANRAIAEQLVIGERTVETHITNILGKLGFTNRAQIAAWTVAHDLAPPQMDGDRSSGWR
ncbi:MAG TPA: AAA family ATPase [Ktedonobacterales bacterium]